MVRPQLREFVTAEELAVVVAHGDVKGLALPAAFSHRENGPSLMDELAKLVQLLITELGFLRSADQEDLRVVPAAYGLIDVDDLPVGFAFELVRCPAGEVGQRPGAIVPVAIVLKAIEHERAPPSGQEQQGEAVSPEAARPGAVTPLVVDQVSGGCLVPVNAADVLVSGGEGDPLYAVEIVRRGLAAGEIVVPLQPFHAPLDCARPELLAALYERFRAQMVHGDEETGDARQRHALLGREMLRTRPGVVPPRLPFNVGVAPAAVRVLGGDPVVVDELPV